MMVFQGSTIVTDTMKEETINAELQAQFPFLNGHVRMQRARRLWADAPADRFDEVFEYIIKRQGFVILCTITGLDDGDYYSIIYHLARQDGIVLNLKVSVPKTGPKWKSVAPAFPGSCFYEREIVELLGVQIAGLPPDLRYPLPDNWPAGEHPLRKDWQKTGSAAERKEAP